MFFLSFCFTAASRCVVVPVAVVIPTMLARRSHRTPTLSNSRVAVAVGFNKGTISGSGLFEKAGSPKSASFESSSSKKSRVKQLLGKLSCISGTPCRSKVPTDTGGSVVLSGDVEKEVRCEVAHLPHLHGSHPTVDLNQTASLSFDETSLEDGCEWTLSIGQDDGVDAFERGVDEPLEHISSSDSIASFASLDSSIPSTDSMLSFDKACALAFSLSGELRSSYKPLSPAQMLDGPESIDSWDSLVDLDDDTFGAAWADAKSTPITPTNYHVEGLDIVVVSGPEDDDEVSSIGKVSSIGEDGGPKTWVERMAEQGHVFDLMDFRYGKDAVKDNTEGKTTVQLSAELCNFRGYGHPGVPAHLWYLPPDLKVIYYILTYVHKLKVRAPTMEELSGGIVSNIVKKRV